MQDFEFNNAFQTSSHPYKLHKRHSLATVRTSYFNCAEYSSSGSCWFFRFCCI